MKIEICVDNLESVITANRFPISRIELCTALSVGGLTPNYGFLCQALEMSKVPLALMIRPRPGDFLYSSSELEIMRRDILLAKQSGVPTVVFGALTATGEIDLRAMEKLMNAAAGMEVTFHRAFDVCRNPVAALEQLIALGCTRLLTSGQAATAFDGIAMIRDLVEQAAGRIQIMAGCGVNAANVKRILHETDVPEIHFSAKGQRQSQMQSTTAATMGAGSQDDVLDIADPDKITAILTEIAR